MATQFNSVPVELALRARVDLEPVLPLVYVVDDEPLIVETLVAILNGIGLAAIPASNGTDALELARLIPPDVLIADVAMPGMNGFELSLELRRMVPDCETILLSGEHSAYDQAREYRAQGIDFVLLVKPVHPLDLLACVFELLNLRGWPIPAEVASRRTNPSDVISLGPLSTLKRKEAASGRKDSASKPSAFRIAAFQRRDPQD